MTVQMGSRKANYKFYDLTIVHSSSCNLSICCVLSLYHTTYLGSCSGYQRPSAAYLPLKSQVTLSLSGLRICEWRPAMPCSE